LTHEMGAPLGAEMVPALEHVQLIVHLQSHSQIVGNVVHG